ncbi:MAG: recombination mediator RecR [Verrucomicrobiota bacterium]|jgi:recombination protein RecR|nr:recombination mediator RecR [Verrucomicrobiota bacterium]
MASLPEPVTELVVALGQLPGIGPRSAERLALHLVQSEAGQVKQLAMALINARDQIQLCKICGALTENQPCSFCTDDRRDATALCVVETAVDVINVDKSGAFKGRYHVLGGKISPLNGVDPEDLCIAELEARMLDVSEIILALGTDVEGDATSNYLAQRLGAKGVKVTRIAHGLPAGSGLEYADDLTLSHALEGRREMS